MRTLTRSLSIVACLIHTLAGCSAGTSSSESSSSGSSSAAGSGGGASSGSSSSSSGAGGSVVFAPGEPLATPAGQWTWVPFDNAFCGNGTSTGIGVNLSSTPGARPLIYLEGGGACWSEITCNTLMTASYFTSGYGAAELAMETADPAYIGLPGGFFDRTSAANPFKDYSYVYIPYCTGDIFSGDNVVPYGSSDAHFVGYRNITVFLDRIVPTFASADRVILAGSSAGGFGAAYNWWRTQQAFGSIRVDLIDDSGTPMPPDIEADGMGETSERTAWNIAATLPPGCSACKASLDGFLPFFDQQFPTHRASLLSYVQDTVLPGFFFISEPQFEQGLAEDISSYFTGSTPFKYFTVNAAGHVLWFDPSLATAGGGTVQQFITKMVTDDPTWASEHP
jgi:hypothetical protein